MTCLFDAIGQSNFDELSSLINEYYSLPYLNMMHEVTHNLDTELTRKFYSYNVRIEEIIKKIDAYTKSKPNLPHH